MLRNLGTLVLMLLLATPLAAVAQNTGRLAGVVVDDLGDPLPGANVILEGTQLGAATDIDGNYFIIGVPVGTYDVTASFVGYQTQTVEAVQISSGYTTEQSFELGPQSLGEVTVTYERPIIQKDAIGAPRVVTGEEISNLPIRGVASVASIQNGVVNNGRDDDLFVRGGREQEIAYYVDGVKVTGSAPIGVNQGAIAEQELLIGTIPARYGDVQSGVISITTKTGRSDFFGSAEFITSEVLDAFGYNLGSLAIGGPIVPGRASFFLSGQGTFESDYNTYSVDTYRLSDDDFAALQQNPQVVRLVCQAGFNCGEGVAAGDEMFIPLSSDLFFDENGGFRDGIDNDSLVTLLGGSIPAGFGVAENNFLVFAPETYTADRFDFERGKDAPRENFTFNGNVNFNISSALSLRLGGGYDRQSTDEFTFGNSLYNRDRFYNDERDSWRAYGTFRQRLSDNAFYQIQGEYQDYKFVQYPNGFSDQVEDALFYGDIDAAYSDIARRYLVFRNGEYQQLFTTDGGGRPTSVGGTFNLPGAQLTRFQQQHDQQFRFSGSATTQLGVHQIEFGGEFEQQTRRFFDIAGGALARYYNDLDGAIAPSAAFPNGVQSYDQLPFDVVEEQIVTRYGYNYLGTEEVDDQDIQAYFDGTSTDVAPHKPIYYAGYVQDKIEFRDLVINLGLRVDVFDNNTPVLLDAFAPFPIARPSNFVGELTNPESNFFQGDGFSIPGSIGSDYALYFNDGGEIVGYRDLDGNFFDAEGISTTQDNVTGAASGQVEEVEAPLSTIFTDYEPQVTFMPRVGVSFPVTDRALFFASYNVTSQRPTEQSFTPFTTYEVLTGQNSRTSNPNLEPEKTTQYELGFRQRVGERAALTLSGFYRTQENKISNRTLFGANPEYGTYLNADFTTTKGVELGFDLRRTSNLSINANYTLSFASGTGSDASSTGTVVWRGTYFPNFISPADFDQRHTGNVSLDYRFGSDEGPMLGGARILENFGVNVLGSFGSGQRYTPLSAAAFSVNDSFTSPVAGQINSLTLPATTRIDLRIDRSFDLGLGNSRLKAYLWVQNLLDTENIVAVYRATGLADQDGYLFTPGGTSFLTNAPDETGRTFNYNTYISGPVNVGGSQSSGGGFFYGPPRRIRLGFLLDF
ncbi:MAG: TonB-dependent receptor [Rhodothermales bacterium]